MARSHLLWKLSRAQLSLLIFSSHCPHIALTLRAHLEKQWRPLGIGAGAPLWLC